MKSHLFATDNLESTAARFALQNKSLLRASVSAGYDVLAKRGSMVAYQGSVSFDHEGAGASRFLKMVGTGEGVHLMRCAGDGDVFFADMKQDVHLITLEGDAMSVEGSHLLAMESGLSWDVSVIAGAGALAGGLANVVVQGHGLLAVTTQGPPVLLDCSQQPTYVDTNAVVGWSASLRPTVSRSYKLAKALTGRGSGEAMQLCFHGPGFVIVQPDETMYATAGAR